MITPLYFIHTQQKESHDNNKKGSSILNINSLGSFFITSNYLSNWGKKNIDLIGKCDRTVHKKGFVRFSTLLKQTEV